MSGTRQMRRVCFELQVRPELINEYIQRHTAVWPQMLRAIERAGRSNYSLFLRDDGMLIGYYEVEDDVASARTLALDPDTAEWEAEAARFFVALGGDRPDQGAPKLREVFHLEDQLTSIGDTH